MTTQTSIPVTITPEAAAYVAALELQASFERMLERTRQTIPKLHKLVVTVQPPYDLGGDPCVLIEGWRDDPELSYDDLEWAHWKSSTYPPEVSQYFVLYTVHVPPHARQSLS